MSNTVKKLAALTLVLFVASISIYYLDHKQNSGVIEGNYFITALDVSKVNSVVIQNGQDKKISFLKDGAVFLMDSHHSYPASTKSVNDLLFKISNIKAMKKISSSSSDHDEYGVTESKAQYKVTFFDDEKNANVEFYIGQRYRSQGNYIRHAGQDEVYLSANALIFSTEPRSYFESKVFGFSINDLKLLTYKGKEVFTIAKDEESGDFVTQELGKDKSDKSKTRDYISGVLNLRLQKYHLPQAAAVLNLKYETEVRIENKDYTNYIISIAKDKESFFFKVTSVVKDIPNQIQLSTQANNEQLANVENLITARGKAQAFNLIHGKWVYEISKNSYEKLIHSLKDFSKS